MTVYNKLVRDRIPEIIRANGAEPVTRILDEAEYRKALRTKLQEEVAEYLEIASIEELADVVEVLRALAVLEGADWNDVERVRVKKLQDRGGFEDRLWLDRV